jgi:hypothetical protein
LTIPRTHITGLNPAAPLTVITLTICITVAQVGSFVAEKGRAGIAKKRRLTKSNKALFLPVAEESIITVLIHTAIIVAELPRVLGDSQPTV